MRLNAMAAERAETMHSTIQPSWDARGMPPAASMAPHKANGSAKIECSHLIISSVILMFEKIGTGHSKSAADGRRSCCKPLLPDQRHKAAAFEQTDGNGPVLLFVRHLQGLLMGISHGDHQPSRGRQLFQQRRRDPRSRRGNDDGIKVRVLRQAE